MLRDLEVIRMSDDDEARRAAAKEAALKTAALFVMLDRAGGRVTFTDDEYMAALERAGGPTSATIHVEIVSAKGQPDEVQLTLVRKPPTNAELVS
jgi:hypothetical protein